VSGVWCIGDVATTISHATSIDGRPATAAVAECNHQGLDNHLIQPDDNVGAVAEEIVCDELLGGMLKYYRRKAA